jgi:hypothetical protein
VLKPFPGEGSVRFLEYWRRPSECKTTGIHLQEQVTRAAAWSTAAATLLAAGNAHAANEIAQLAARDNRLGIIATLFVPVLGWVAYNIGGPALNQFKNAGVKCVAALLFLAAQNACCNTAQTLSPVG